MVMLGAILGNIDVGQLTLPSFQRGYVWNRRDVRELMRSLYHEYPIGSFLVWNTSSGTLLLDGQQRLTSLYGIVRGKAPAFSDADPNSFLNLYFNLDSEEFEFYGPTKMKNNPRWVSITEVMKDGPGKFLKLFVEDPNLTSYIDRLGRITNINNRNIHVEPIAGAGRTMDEVVDMFNQVNSGGTKLSKGDLALAKISADWPQARQVIVDHLKIWEDKGYKFKIEWLLRCTNALVTKQSQFEFLDGIPIETIRDGLKRAEKHADSALALLAAKLGLDHHQVMGSPNSLPAVLLFFDKANTWPDQATLDRLLYWYIHAMLWRRYSGPVETVMRQDLHAVDENADAVGALIQRLRQNRSDLTVRPTDFTGWTRGSVFYPLLYLLTRVYGARDLGTGIELKKGLLGGMFQLELHHIFPKAQLYKYGYDRRDVNAVANFSFLFQKTNAQISAKLPEDYFSYYESKYPGVLASHWIPMDEQLWKIENYPDFLAARRERLAEAANNFLDELYHGTIPETAVVEQKTDRDGRFRPASIASDEEAAALNDVMEWMERKGLPRGEYGYELVDSENDIVATFDLAWPDGIQVGKSRPVALLIDEDPNTLETANHENVEYFTDIVDFKRHVQREILGEPA